MTLSTSSKIRALASAKGKNGGLFPETMGHVERLPICCPGKLEVYSVSVVGRLPLDTVFILMRYNQRFVAFGRNKMVKISLHNTILWMLAC
jgi:hypothetical protein